MELEILAVMGPLKRKKISLSVPFYSTNLLIGKKVTRFYCYLLIVITYILRKTELFI
jgi:hypothetical protein